MAVLEQLLVVLAVLAVAVTLVATVLLELLERPTQVAVEVGRGIRPLTLVVQELFM